MSLTKDDLQAIQGIVTNTIVKDVPGIVQPMFDNFEGRINKKIDAVNRRIDTLDHRVDALDQRIDRLDQRIDMVSEALTQRIDMVHDVVIQRIDIVHDTIIQRIDSLDDSLSMQMEAGLQEVRGQLDDHEVRLHGVKGKLKVRVA